MTAPNKWDRRWLNLAKHFSEWSKDPSTRVGAVFVRDRRPLSQGWNGFPRGIHDDDERLDNRDVKYRLTVHAEMNAIYNAGYIGVSLNGSTLYVYGLPVCSDCSKGIIQTGVKSIHTVFPDSLSPKWNESGAAAHSLFKEAGIPYSRVDEETGESKKFPWET